MTTPGANGVKLSRSPVHMDDVAEIHLQSRSPSSQPVLNAHAPPVPLTQPSISVFGTKFNDFSSLKMAFVRSGMRVCLWVGT